MSSKKPSEHEKLFELLETFQLILHPDVFKKLSAQINAAYEENKREAFANACISDDALWIEKKLTDLRQTMKRPGNDDPRMQSFFLKNFYKQLIQKFIP